MLNWPEKYAHKGGHIREQAIKEYKITPVFHGALLPNQIKKGYFNQKITTNYYCFEFRPLNNINNFGFFYCGDDAAEKWLFLIGETQLPLFNPLSVHRPVEQNDRKNTLNERRLQKTTNPIRRDLLVILKTLIALFDITNYSSAIPQVLKRISEDRDLDKQPPDRDIKAVNTIIYKSIVCSNMSLNYHDYISKKELEFNCVFRKINYTRINQIINFIGNTYPASF